ncbi:MAG TPA: hypothetical protein PLJ13_15100, partial [Cyclobacteriaceae bacterium]|nr:hypothetical protein [Cyclobacteriaceae bacterium]
LCKSHTKYFLVTASHVIRDTKTQNIFTIGRNQNLVSLYPALGRNRYIDNPSSKNQCDIEVIELEPNMLNLISDRFEFLEIDKVRLNPFPFDRTTDYLISGLPAALTEDPIKFRENKVKYLGLPAKLSEEKWYNKLGYIFGQHIIVDMPKRLAKPIKGNDTRMIKPNGMSGGGLWVVPDQNIEHSQVPFYQLVGVLIEYVTNGHRCIISTNIGYAFELMRTAFNADFSLDFKTNFNLEKKQKHVT